MLTARENMRRTVFGGGKPDRYVNQFEALKFLGTPFIYHNPSPRKGELNVVNAWGITNSYPNNAPAAFPVHTEDKIVVKDIEDWKEYVKAPSFDIWTEQEWDKMIARYEKVDRSKAYACTLIAPGIFEQIHHLCAIDNALMYCMTNEDEMMDLIKYLKDWEMEYARLICERLHPDCILHHDDWGSELNTFLRPSMFDDYFLEPYKELYGYYHDHGVEMIIHHSDSYGVSIVPEMIEMGIDVWQGPMHTNNVPELVKQYKGKICFMGEIDNKMVDFNESDINVCRDVVKRTIESVNSMESFIPCITQGGPGALYSGVYEDLWDAIDEYNIEHFGCTKEELEEARYPRFVMFPGDPKTPKDK